MNSADIAVVIAVGLMVLMAAVILWRNRKKGKGGCGCQYPGGCGCQYPGCHYPGGCGCGCGKSAPPDEPIKKSCR